MKPATKREKYAYLKEVAKSYNLNTRAIRGDGSSNSCSYLNSHGKKCAIGRRLDDDLCEKLDSCFSSGVGNETIFSMLPEDMQKYGQVFLGELQNFHDISHNWNDTGLSDSGKKVYDIIYQKVKTGVL